MSWARIQAHQKFYSFLTVTILMETQQFFLVATENSDEKVEFENFGRAGYIFKKNGGMVIFVKTLVVFERFWREG